MVAEGGEADRHADPRQPVHDPAEDRAEPVAGPKEQVALGIGMDDQDGDGDREAKPVPGHPTPDPGSLAVARRFVVLGRPELLGVEPEHDQEEHQPDRDERSGEDVEVVHAAGC